MDKDVQEVINEYTGKRIDKLEIRMDKFEERLDTVEDKIETINIKMDSQSQMLQMLIDGQEESRKRRKGYLDSAINKVILLIVGGVFSFLGMAIMNYIKMLLK